MVTIPVGDSGAQPCALQYLAPWDSPPVFFLYAAPVKETPWLFDHAPWLNDQVRHRHVNFMMFFVPFVAVLCIPRILQCRRSEPLRLPD